MLSLLAATLGLAAVASAQADGRSKLMRPPGQPDMPALPAAPGYSYDHCWALYPIGTPCPIQNSTFDQLIDHNNPSLGTFKQRYWINTENYAGPGSPIILHGPNESEADYQVWYASNYTGDGQMAQDVKGAAIVIEHRYYGQSSPYDSLDTKTMQYLTLDQSMRDLTHFARTVKLPFQGSDGSESSTTHPDNSPWIYSGGSYPGALATWIQKVYPGTFWAYHATSAVVQPMADYWQYYVPIEKAMPANCSSDYKKAMARLDTMLKDASPAQKDHIKGRFGLAGLEDDDFGWAIIGPMQDWQGTQFYSGGATLFDMCDWIEGANKATATSDPIHVPGAEGVGACKALKNLATYMRTKYIPGSCANKYWSDPNSIACWDLHNTSGPFYTDRKPYNKWNLQWQWFSCNEPFQQWQASAPGDTGLIPKFLTMQDLRDQCDRFFPDVDGFQYGLKAGRTTEEIVKLTGGWDFTNTTRLLYVNGEYDPWLMETVSSPSRPRGPLKSTPEVPVFVVPKAAHCPDMVMRNVNSNKELAEIYAQTHKIMTGWISDFYTEKGKKQPGF